MRIEEFRAELHETRSVGPEQGAGHLAVRVDLPQKRTIGGHLAKVGGGYPGFPRRWWPVRFVVDDQHLFRADKDSVELSGDRTRPFAPLERWSRLDTGDLVALDPSGWEELSRGTPVRRATRFGLRRNAILLAAHLGDDDALDRGCGDERSVADGPEGVELRDFARRVRAHKRGKAAP